MFIVGYELTYAIDQGDAWVNAVDPKGGSFIAHKECAWNNDYLALGSDVVDLRRITHEEAQGLRKPCELCNAPLTEKRYFAFQASMLSER